jgi:hypothetical protein
MVDAEGHQIGTIEAIYLDRHTGEPAWATVKTGPFGTKHSFVPIAEAELTDDGQVRPTRPKIERFRATPPG